MNPVIPTTPLIPHPSLPHSDHEPLHSSTTTTLLCIVGLELILTCARDFHSSKLIRIFFRSRPLRLSASHNLLSTYSFGTLPISAITIVKTRVYSERRTSDQFLFCAKHRPLNRCLRASRVNPCQEGGEPVAHLYLLWSSLSRRVREPSTG